MNELDGRMTLEQDFLDFHATNPEVFTHLVALVRKAKSVGVTRYGIAALFEVLRWEVLLQRRPPAGALEVEDFKLNNNYRAFYARLIMQTHPEFDGFFEVREQRVPFSGAGGPLPIPPSTIPGTLQAVRALMALEAEAALMPGVRQWRTP